MSASDDAVFSRVVLGFDQCAGIAAKYNLTDALDHIIFCLSSMSTLASEIPANTALNTEVQAERKSVMVSELAVKFGRDYKAQLACAVLFRLIPKKEAHIKDGWNHVGNFTNAVSFLADLPTDRPHMAQSLCKFFVNVFIFKFHGCT